MRIMMIMQFRLYFYFLKTFATKSFVTWFGDNEQKRDLNIFSSFDQQEKRFGNKNWIKIKIPLIHYFLLHNEIQGSLCVYV